MGFVQGCAMIRELELKHLLSKSAWVVAFGKFLECPHCSLHQRPCESAAQQTPHSQHWGLQASPDFPRCWSCHLSPISFLSSLLGSHLYYCFVSHGSRSFQWQNLFHIPCGSHTSASQPPGDSVGGGEGRDYQRVIKMFIIDHGDGFMVHAYVKTNQIACFKQVLFTVCQLHFNKTMEKKESPGGCETFHF